eukprot:TRINITY_DN1995_c1_g2_i2.p1 TRINITY_DN1995_c1_g2~~TRINITY_DN1995_c1_g2_i2.p1  ORF type:complete len:205 (-),score=22.70 TRINITY_DN1995_c1_g2_i2:56-607(-)
MNIQLGKDTLAVNDIYRLDCHHIAANPPGAVALATQVLSIKDAVFKWVDGRDEKALLHLLKWLHKRKCHPDTWFITKCKSSIVSEHHMYLNNNIIIIISLSLSLCLSLSLSRLSIMYVLVEDTLGILSTSGLPLLLPYPHILFLQSIGLLLGSATAVAMWNAQGLIARELASQASSHHGCGFA